MGMGHFPAVGPIISHHATASAQFLIPVENDLAHCDVQTIIKSSKRGVAEPAEEIAGFLSGTLMPSRGLTTR